MDGRERPHAWDRGGPGPDGFCGVCGGIKAKLLILHGADDPFVQPEDLAAFQEELRKSGVDWQMISYGGAVHSSTQVRAGTDKSKGAAYHEPSARRSWQAMTGFFAGR